MVKCLIRIKTKVNVHLRMINHCYRDVKVRVLTLGPRLLGNVLGALPIIPSLPESSSSSGISLSPFGQSLRATDSSHVNSHSMPEHSISRSTSLLSTRYSGPEGRNGEARFTEESHKPSSDVLPTPEFNSTHDQEWSNLGPAARNISPLSTAWLPTRQTITLPEGLDKQWVLERSKEHREVDGGSEKHGKANGGGARSKGEASGGKRGPKARQVGGARIKARQVGGARNRSETGGRSTGPDGKARGPHATSTTEWRRRAMTTAEQQSRATSTAEPQGRATSNDERRHRVTTPVLLTLETPQGVGGQEPDTAGTLLQRREVRPPEPPNFYRRFIQNYRTIASPLTFLLRGKPQNCSTQSFISTPILLHPDPNRPFIIKVDASSCGIGAVLSQRHGSPGKVYPCAYFSRKLMLADVNYDVGN
ncbi:hypothetical protein QTP86_028506 [Hemibagrus guttatus]|nr:hypothetical protein QTP86_028506 [Hemibagrus guttatus]